MLFVILGLLAGLTVSVVGGVADGSGYWYDLVYDFVLRSYTDLAESFDGSIMDKNFLSAVGVVLALIAPGMLVLFSMLAQKTVSFTSTLAGMVLFVAGLYSFWVLSAGRAFLVVGLFGLFVLGISPVFRWLQIFCGWAVFGVLSFDFVGLFVNNILEYSPIVYSAEVLSEISGFESNITVLVSVGLAAWSFLTSAWWSLTKL